MNVGQLRERLADCGDGIEVKIDSRPLIVAQVEGADPAVLNLVSDPHNVAGQIDTLTLPLPLLSRPDDDDVPPADHEHDVAPDPDPADTTDADDSPI